MQPFIYLASASPRRRELLGQLGIQCQVMPADIDESVLPGEAAADYVLRLARAKARVIAGQPRAPEAPVLAADTAVVMGDLVLGKPASLADARVMLGRLSGQTHVVFTAVAVAADGREESALNRSQVSFRAIAPAEIDAYWATGEPADKAGAYAIQGLGAVFVEDLRGSYSGVMGLPLFETAELLGRFGIHVLATGQ